MNVNGFDSDEQEQYFLEQEHRRQQERAEEEHYYELLSMLKHAALELGLDHSISFLNNLKEENE